MEDKIGDNLLGVIRPVFRIILLLFFLSAIVQDGFAVQRATEVFLSADEEGRKPLEVFDCHDRVFIHAVFSDLKNGTHEASVVWLNPKGRRQDYSNFRFSESNYRVWFWLKLKPAFGGKLLKSFDPSFGMEEFIGTWTARLYLDEKTIVEKHFFVGC